MDRPKNQTWLRLALPLVMLASMFVIYFPLPPSLMDFLLAANLTVSVVLLMAAIFVKNTLELRVFPSLLLITTLSRLALNVATTRLILINGASDRELAAGEIIRGFSEFVAGSSLVVGAIIFLILFLVQFLVITKGATRIGEVAARFALDSIPGQQMAIDADLNMGVIEHDEAQRRRIRLRQFADFQGAMDGASKYIRGDAIAGMAIVGVNIVGGLLQGMSHGMSVTEAGETFTRLTIGDGLVSQLPALLISIAAGLLVTRGTDDNDLPVESIRQLAGSPMALWSSAAFVFVLPIANLPAMPLWTLGLILAYSGYLVSKAQNESQVLTAKANEKSATPPPEPMLERFLETDQLELQVGVSLLSLCDSGRGGNLVQNISALRREIATEYGFVLPKVRIRDNLQLPAESFRILVNGNPVVTAEVNPKKELLVFRRGDFPVQQRRASLPWAAYAMWDDADSELKENAMLVVQPADAIARTVYWLSAEYADELLTRDATADLINEVKKTYPRLVEDTIPEVVSMGQLQRILRQLLREGIGLRPMHLILETIAEAKVAGSDVDDLVGLVRDALKEHTIQRLKNGNGQIACFGISDELTDSLEGSIQPEDERSVSGKFSAAIRRNLRAAVNAGRNHLLGLGYRPVLLVSQEIFDVVKNTVSEMHPRVLVLGEHEIVNESIINKLAEITPGDVGNTATSSAA
ncbi:MAG: flagellar biosynthesis protein FlhA [Pirellulaceae bacterium]